jgi:pre-mRNA cleavage complex 2 protein Pcf11
MCTPLYNTLTATYTAFQDWIHNVSVDMNANAAAAAVIVQRDAELRALYVIVPLGNEAKPVLCPICEETIKSEFIDED